MNCFEDTYVLAEGPYGESPFTRFGNLRRPEKHLVIKRTGDSWKTLAALPGEIGLICCIRHPLDTLISTHPLSSHLRKYHIIPGRWISEYRALQALRLAQPERKILFVKYEDLISNADLIQERIAARFGLTVRRSFTTADIPIHAGSIGRWTRKSDFQSYLYGLSDDTRRVIRDFCREFAYALPDDYAPGTPETRYKFRFSVIIPLEFHRGHVEECLRGWVDEQTFPADRYEILAVGCPSSLNEEIRSIVKGVLRPHDRFLLHDDPHDIALCAAASREAGGEILVFTESHCKPMPDVLSLSDARMRQQPEWAGFSGRSLPVTPNRLSEVEAEMYEKDIKHGMLDHEWRRILDQLFVVRSREYHNSGGFVPALGHFAEWHLAARMHKNEYHVGYAPDVQFWHHYIGQIRELIEFTANFTRGEMFYWSEFTDDPCREYFPAPAEWLDRYCWLPEYANEALRMAWRSLATAGPAALAPRELLCRLRMITGWFLRGLGGTFTTTTQARLLRSFSVAVLKLANILRVDRKHLLRLFVNVITSTIRLERVRFVAHWLKRRGQDQRNVGRAPASSITWSPEASQDDTAAIGFYPLEEWKGEKFRWSQPLASVELGLRPGDYNLEMRWLMVRPIRQLDLYLNGAPIPLSLSAGKVTGGFRVTTDIPVHLSWSCEPWTATRNDPRYFGLPITSITCLRRGS
jgi:hypothetical protein